MADEQTQETEGTAQPAKSGGIVRMAGLAVGLFVLMSASQLTTAIIAKSFFPDAVYYNPLMEEEEEVAEEEMEEMEVAELDPPMYAAMSPPIIVSFQTETELRFLQVTVEAMARDEQSIDAFTQHTPAIRNDLLTMFASKRLEDLATVAGKEAARQEALEITQSILTRVDPEAMVEDLYFTGFVVQ